jgi:hypothetical protein
VILRSFALIDNKDDLSMPTTGKHAKVDEIDAIVKAFSSIKRQSVRREIIQTVKVVAAAVDTAGRKTGTS